MDQTTTIKIDACHAKGFRVATGETFRVINTYGDQVVAVWAFVPSNVKEFMSMEHTRIHAKSSRPGLGTLFYTNFHTPILEMTMDRSPGVHDWYLAACNQQRYELLGHSGDHANCADNLHSVMTALDHSIDYVPCPLNLFENVSFLFGNPMDIKEPVAMPGDYVGFKAQIDCLVVLSACPQDIAMTNGPDHVPKSVDVQLVNAVV